MKKHIVIVGGGFAGINLMKSLENDTRFRITLVDKNNYHFSRHSSTKLLLLLLRLPTSAIRSGR